MTECGNPVLRFVVGAEGELRLLEDRVRGVTWRSSGGAGWRHVRDPFRVPFGEGGGAECDAPLRPLPPGRVERAGDAVRVVHALPDGAVTATYVLAADHLAITVTADSPSVREVTLPGSFLPAEGGERLLLPRFQGGYFNATGRPFDGFAYPGTHSGFTLPMLAVEGEAAALLACQETETDWSARYGERADGRLFGAFSQLRCPVNGWYPRELRLYPADPGATAVAKVFRRRMIARGLFRNWEEKIAEKPILEKLFGCCIAFTGYNADPGLDYAAGAAKMRAYGFTSVLYCPVRIFQRTRDFSMGGDPPVWLDDAAIAAIRRVEGALVAPWGWTIESQEDGSPAAVRAHAHDAEGRTSLSWKIDEQRWVRTCPPYQIEEMREAWRGPLAGLDWIHYDVNAQIPGVRCFRPDHALHGGRPIGNRETAGYYRELLGSGTNGNRIVSSEGFNPAYAAQYDIGSVKGLPQWGRRRWTSVPLTQLVYHDGLIHDWWEVHGYTELPSFRPPAGADPDAYAMGSGQGALKAAMDALYGCPPNVFPFGRQYYWVDGVWGKTASFSLRFEDEAVQRALAHALPVARLHARTGREELVSHRFLSGDFAVQETVFANGLRVAANFADEPREAPGLREPLAPVSWRVLEAE